MAEPIIVITNTPTKQEALQIASAAVEQHLAASVNISGPMTSVYRWEGKVETAEEWQCLIKTVHEHYSSVEQLIHKFHSYKPYLLMRGVRIVALSHCRKTPSERD